MNKKSVIVVIMATILVGLGYFYIARKTTGENNVFMMLKDKVFSTPEEPVNVIICWTPLQMVIAEKLIEKHPTEKFYTIMMSYNKNKTYEYYFNRLKSKSLKAYSFYFNESPDTRNFVYTALLELKLKAALLPSDIKTFYFANMEKPEIHTILSSFPDAEIKTFDDGTANLVNSHIVEKGEYTPKNGRILYKYLNQYTKEKVKNKISEHYTIFYGIPNMMEKIRGEKLKITHIELFDATKKKKETEIKDSISILLGVPEPSSLKETLEKIAKDFDIKYTAKHPRQEYDVDGVELIKTELIIEDYILQEIEKNPNRLYKIYSLFSSAGLIMKDFPNVEIINLETKEGVARKELKQLFELQGM
ncbi:MAG: glycosyltransferase family 52, partial [Bergeyella zoohelcum]|nr:glycosyltransferase family 52 [Bergeyella zoohelcum]